MSEMSWENITIKGKIIVKDGQVFVCDNTRIFGFTDKMLSYPEIKVPDLKWHQRAWIRIDLRVRKVLKI